MSEKFSFTGTARMIGKREYIRAPHGKMLADPGTILVEADDGRAVIIFSREDYESLFKRKAPALGKGDGEPQNPPSTSDLPLERTATEPENGNDPPPENEPVTEGVDQKDPKDRGARAGSDQTAPQDRVGDPKRAPSQKAPEDRAKTTTAKKK